MSKVVPIVLFRRTSGPLAWLVVPMTSSVEIERDAVQGISFIVLRYLPDEASPFAQMTGNNLHTWESIECAWKIASGKLSIHG